MLVIGIILGFIVTSMLDNYLQKKRLILNYKLLAVIVVILWFIYSLIGLFFETNYTNNNICKGFEYGIQICEK